MQDIPRALVMETVSVGRVASYLRRKLDADPKLRTLRVRGEVSGLTSVTKGNLYFDLKDPDAVLKCVAWADNAVDFPALANGLEIIATGSIGTYPKRSSYQLLVVAVELEGAGRLHARYEALKRRLSAEGLFAVERKRALPAYPFRVALVSSRTANGAGDFLTQAAALAPHVAIDVFETPVQGDAAAPEIVRAIDRASRAAVDLVVLARGGGSYEDLFVFNDERVVRALARCAHPTVSAIGHEADAPLTDFVADHRAPTPSTAAQTVLGRRADLLRSIAESAQRLDRAAVRNLTRLRSELRRIEFRSPLAAPDRLLLTRRQGIDVTLLDLNRAIGERLRRRRELLAAATGRLETGNPSVRLSRRRERFAVVSYALAAAGRAAVARERRRLDALAARLEPAVRAGVLRRETRRRLIEAMLDGRDPTKILARGYAIVSFPGGVLRDASSVGPGARIRAQLARGTLLARVESVEADGGE